MLNPTRRDAECLPADPSVLGSDNRQTPFPELRTATTEILFGEARIPDLWGDLAPAITAAAADDDPRVRRQSFPFRLWRSGNPSSDVDGAESFEELATDAARFVGGDEYDRGDALCEILIARELGAGWMGRGRHDLAAQASENEIRWSAMFQLPELRRSAQASLGIVLTLGGYVVDGLGLITRAAAHSVDCSTYDCIGPGFGLRQDRHLVIEFADADEHTRNHRRALRSYQTALALIGPNEHYARIHQYWALVRCLCKAGKPEVAAETFAQLPEQNDPLDHALAAKRLRTTTVLDAAGGDVTGALERCSAGLSRFTRSHLRALHREVAVEGSSIARAHDEPHWVIDQLGSDDHTDNGGVPLMGTYSYEDLGWAYARVGDRSNARRSHQLARQGRHRFFARTPWAAGAEPPGILVSFQTLNRQAGRSRIVERRSLQRGISSVVHDIRNQLQSLELLTIQHDERAQPEDAPPERPIRRSHHGPPVDSIINTVDDTLADLLHDIDTNRTVELADVHLGGLLDETVARFSSNAANKKIDLHHEIDPSIMCRADGRALDRIASNLISNAIKYSPIGGSVLITATPIGDTYVDVHFTDSGPGIPADEVDQLFGWGSVLSSTPTAGETQNGIGLFTAHRLAQMIGATIRAHPKTSTTASTMTVRMERTRRCTPSQAPKPVDPRARVATPSDP